MRSKFSDFEDEEDGGEEADWKDSYSDLMTDLLAVFVLLLSFAMMNQAFETERRAMARDTEDRKIIAISDGGEMLPAIRDNAISSQDNMNQSGDGNGEDILSQQGFNSLYESIKAYIDEEGLSKVLGVTKEGENQILLRVAASVFFDSGVADINPKAEPLLERISELLMQYDKSIKMVRIEGHTDNRPIKTKQFDSNWELSTSRAVNVLKRILEESKLEPVKLSAVGYGEFYPIDGNDTEINRARNRRVDFFIEAVVNEKE